LVNRLTPLSKFAQGWHNACYILNVYTINVEADSSLYYSIKAINIYNVDLDSALGKIAQHKFAEKCDTKVHQTAQARGETNKKLKRGCCQSNEHLEIICQAIQQ
jgi:hypothetical protein